MSQSEASKLIKGATGDWEVIVGLEVHAQVTSRSLWHQQHLQSAMRAGQPGFDQHLNALQGFLGGSMIPTVFTTAFVYFQGHQRVIAAATIGALSSLAPTLGPTVGGWITDNYSWHWLFFVNLVPGIFVTIVVPPRNGSNKLSQTLFSPRK